MDSEAFPDIFSKPGQFLPGLGGNKPAAQFEEINFDEMDASEETKSKAKDLHGKVHAEKAKAIEKEKN